MGYSIGLHDVELDDGFKARVHLATKCDLHSKKLGWMSLTAFDWPCR